MNKYKYLLVLSIYFSSCSISGSFQGLYGYQKKVTKIDSNLIQKSKEDICLISTPRDPIIYRINGKDLRKCINNTPKALLYIWRPNCSSKICIPLNNLQKICTNNNMELFIVAEYYDYEKMIKKYEINKPIWGIDCKFYKSNLTKKYLQRFINDITESNESYENDYFYYFESGKLIHKSNSIQFK